jgi:type I restriction enzyme S subunit
MTTMAIDNKDKKVLNVPHLRFPEFSGEWENTELQYIAPNICSGKDKPTSNGTVALYGSTGIIGMTRLASYNEEIVLVARVGANAGQLQITTIPCGVTDNTLIINAKEWNRYIYYYLQHYNLNRLVFGSGQPLITGSMLKKLKIIYGEESERNKIVNLLCLLDERIATQNKIIEKLQSLIKGLRVCCMQRVYGNNVYLSEIAQIYQPQTISSTELTEDGFLVYGANGIIGKYKDYNHETEQICITCRGNTCGMVNYTKPMSWITGNAMVINTDKYQDKVCKRYLYHYLSAYNFNSIISGSGQPQIVRTPLEKLKITLPTISEQKQKAIIFDKIQDKIDINHKVLNLYIGQKQYLLRQMFI